MRRIAPLVSARLTAHAQLRLALARRPVHSRSNGGPGITSKVTPLHRGVFDHVWSCRAASDAPCRAACARRLSADRISRGAKDRIPSVLVKARRSFGPKRLPSMNAPERRSLSRLPRDPIFLSFRSGARHRSRSFAATIRLPTFLRSAMRSRAAELDPFLRSVAHRLRRRMRPTSFIDFCNRIVPRARPRFVRAPLHRAYGRPSRSLFRTSLAPTLSRRAIRVTGARVAACLVRRCAFAPRRESHSSFESSRRLIRANPSSTEASREFTGQGPRMAPERTCRRLPLRSLAAEASPQPDRPEHLLSLTRCPRRGDVRGAGAMRRVPLRRRFELAGRRGR